MASSVPDHYLWLGLGIFTVLAIPLVSSGLHHIRHLTTIHNSVPLPPPPQSHPTHQEDAIKTSSLLTLATSHNTDIRASATKILCTRFYANKSAKKLLLRDLKSKDGDVRHRAQLALNLLCEMGVWKDGDAVAPRSGRGAWRLVGDARRGGEEQERDLRRRRREAVVIHEGSGAIGQGDLYMRDEEGTMGMGDERRGTEELLEDLMRLA
ncbi:hypothetical protein ACN47E_002843 [Coniothyrium glycines]